VAVRLAEVFIEAEPVVKRIDHRQIASTPLRIVNIGPQVLVGPGRQLSVQLFDTQSFDVDNGAGRTIPVMLTQMER